MKDVSNYHISDVEVLGMEFKKIPIPLRLIRYAEHPLSSYRLSLKYRWHHLRSPRTEFTGKCMLLLKTLLKNDDDLVIVQGHISIHGAPFYLQRLLNFVPKQKLTPPDLNSFVADYVARPHSLGDNFFKPEIFGTIKTSLFTCNRSIVPMIHGFNADDTLDKVSVDMNLFKPVV